MNRLLVFFVIIISAALLVGTAQGGKEIDRIVAVVNDDIVTLSELEGASKTFFQVPEEKARDEKSLQEMRRRVLDQLVEAKLVDQEAKRLGIVVTEREIDEAIEDVRKINKISKEELLQVLAKEVVSLELYRSQIKDQIEKMKLINQEVRSRVAITEEQLRAYYQEHISSYQTAVRVRPRIILFPVSTGASGEVREETKKEGQAVLEKIRAGEEFEALARQFSKGPNAQAGGDMGFLKPEEMEESFRQAALGLNKGQVSQLVPTQAGFLIIKLEEKEEKRTIPFEEVKDKIKKELYAKALDGQFDQWIKKVKERAHIEVRL